MIIIKVKHTLKPIYNKHSKILILGTMPSIVSRTNNFYYSNPSNRFWRVLSILFNTKLDTNVKRKDFLLKNRIALWDTVKSCEINNSKDSSITNIQVNNINRIINQSNIEYIYVTGKKALEIYNKYIKTTTKIDAIYLPSTSSANAKMNLQDLTEKYKIIKYNL